MWSRRLLALHSNIVQPKLSKYVVKNIAQENYLCNVGSQHTVVFLRENYLQNVLLTWPGQHCTKNSCAMLAHSPQINVYIKIIYKCVWIYLGRHRVMCQSGRLGLLMRQLATQCWFHALFSGLFSNYGTVLRS